MDQSKTCARCKLDLPVVAFYRDRIRPDGRHPTCRNCAAESKPDEGSGSRSRGRRDEAGKTCPRCLLYRTRDGFGKNRSSPDGVQTYCRPCSYEAQKRSEARNPEIVAARRAEKLAIPVGPWTKTCTKCGDTKPAIEFYRHRSTKDGRSTHCRKCFQAYQRARRERIGPDAVREVNRKARAKRAQDPAKLRKYLRAQKSNWLRLYGLTSESYTALLQKQGGGCAICGAEGGTWDDRALNVDHDHETNEVRGLLCSPCNMAIGFLRDDVTRLHAAIEYLKNPPAQ